MSKKHKKQTKPEMHLALEGNFNRNRKAKPRLTPEQRRIKSDAWRVLDARRPRLSEL